MAVLFSMLAGLMAFSVVWAAWPQSQPAIVVAADRSGNFIDSVPGLRPLVQAIAPTLREGLPGVVDQLERKLILAGRPGGRIRADEILAAALVATAVYAPICAAAFGTLMGSSGLVLGAAVGVFGPIGYALFSVDRTLKTRTRRFDQQFPYLLDFLVMMKEAGENLPMALRLYVNSVGATELGDAMRVVADGMNTHVDGLRGALMDLHDECPSAVGRSTIQSILVAEDMGARSTAMLRDIARDMRSTRYEQAEKLAERIKAASAIPAVIMFTGAFLIILAGSLGKMMAFVR